MPVDPTVKPVRPVSPFHKKHESSSVIKTSGSRRQVRSQSEKQISIVRSHTGAPNDLVSYYLYTTLFCGSGHYFRLAIGSQKY